MESPRFQLVLHPGKQVAGKEVAVNFHQLDTPQKQQSSSLKSVLRIPYVFQDVPKWLGELKAGESPKEGNA